MDIWLYDIWINEYTGTYGCTYSLIGSGGTDPAAIGGSDHCARRVA